MPALKFHCLGGDCPSSCCGSFCPVSDRLRPTGQIGFQEIILLPKDRAALVKAGREDLIVDKPDGLSTIKTAKDGTCAALEQGRCTVYQARPAVCRCFPLYIDLYAGICVDGSCPVSDGLTLASFDAQTKEALLEIYEYWIEVYRAGPR